MSEATPVFAVVGAVNHGKSSVVAALSEDDRVQISRMPGETIECQQFWLGDLFRFWDTPGFQNAIEALELLEPARNASDPLQVFREFIARHQNEKQFEAECRLLQPIVEGAGIIYVVDGSRPLILMHLAEMEILRLTGQPRLAIINRTDRDDHVGQWKQKLGAHFNAVREFNAHYATFADREELLDTLASIEQQWKPKLKQAVEVYKSDQRERIDESATIIAEFLIEALEYREEEPLESDAPARRERQAAALCERFKRSLSTLESRTHTQLIELFRHHHLRPDEQSELPFDEGLFSEETWKLFGLDKGQLVRLSAMGGASLGAATDLLTVGHTFLAGTAIGAAAGGLIGVWLGKKQPEIKVDLIKALSPTGNQGIEIAGRRLAVGPYSAINFPWILLDRAIGIFYSVVNRSHARQDRGAIDSARVWHQMETVGIATTMWPAEIRQQCERVFTAVRKGKLTREDREALSRLIHEQLKRVASGGKAEGWRMEDRG